MLSLTGIQKVPSVTSGVNPHFLKIDSVRSCLAWIYRQGTESSLASWYSPSWL